VRRWKQHRSAALKLAEPHLWVCLRFNVLPTDPRFVALTWEQIDALYWAHRRDVQRMAGKNPDSEREDPDYDAWERDVAAEEGYAPVAAPGPDDFKPPTCAADLDDVDRWADA
jgi:hypothetical protein